MRHALVVIALCAQAHAGVEQRAWVKEIPDAKTWKSYSKTVGSDELLLLLRLHLDG